MLLAIIIAIIAFTLQFVLLKLTDDVDNESIASAIFKSIIFTIFCILAMNFLLSLGVFAKDERYQCALEPIVNDDTGVYYLLDDSTLNTYTYKTNDNQTETHTIDHAIATINYRDEPYVLISDKNNEQTINNTTQKPYMSVHRYYYDGIMKILMGGFETEYTQYTFYIPSNSTLNVVHEN